MQDLMDTEKNKWREILHSVVEVIKFLCKENLLLRCHREDSNSKNQGNFLETLRLLAKYNAVINPLRDIRIWLYNKITMIQ